MGAEHTTHGFEVGAVVHLHDHIPQVPEGRTFILWGTCVGLCRLRMGLCIIV
jgi:hypothetical protein